MVEWCSASPYWKVSHYLSWLAPRLQRRKLVFPLDPLRRWQVEANRCWARGGAPARTPLTPNLQIPNGKPIQRPVTPCVWVYIDNWPNNNNNAKTVINTMLFVNHVVHCDRRIETEAVEYDIYCPNKPFSASKSSVVRHPSQLTSVT